MHRAIVATILLLLPACGSGSASRVARTTLPMPSAADERRALLEAFGQELFAALQAGVPERVLADDTELHALLTPPVATRHAALRGVTAHGLDAATPEQLRLALAHATFAGLCLQGSREVEPGTSDGLLAAGWVLERVLVAGDDPQAGRIAAWVEGTFLRTDRGIVAISLDRVEAPRQRHADLEMGTCDMSVGLDDHKL